MPAFEYRNIDGWAALSHPTQARFMHLNDGPRSSVAATTLNRRGGLRRQQLLRSESALQHPVKPVQDPAQEPYADPPGFVHTSYNLLYDYGKFPVNANCSGPQCPPTELFEKHNEWFCAFRHVTSPLSVCLWLTGISPKD